MTLLDRTVAWLDARFGYVKHEPTTLNCGCPNLGARYIRDCGHSACEQHRSQAHPCALAGLQLTPLRTCDANPGGFCLEALADRSGCWLGSDEDPSTCRAIEPTSKGDRL